MSKGLHYFVIGVNGNVSTNEIVLRKFDNKKNSINKLKSKELRT